MKLAVFPGASLGHSKVCRYIFPLLGNRPPSHADSEKTQTYTTLAFIWAPEGCGDQRLRGLCLLGAALVFVGTPLLCKEPAWHGAWAVLVLRKDATELCASLSTL